jgi:hypothetical protein
VFRHLFGADLDEVYGWDEIRYQRHKQYAEAVLKNMTGGNGG